MGGSQSIINRIKNKTVLKSDIDLFNNIINSFIVNSIIKSASECTGKTEIKTVSLTGDIIAIGEGSVTRKSIDRTQEANITTLCLQKTIQEIDIASEISQGIMENIINIIDTQNINKLVNEANAKIDTGFLENPFDNLNADIILDLKNIQEFETKRKLANVISNTVSNNINVKDIKICGTELFMYISETGKNIISLDGGSSNVYLTSKQIANSILNCKQLTQQTSTITNSLALTLDLNIIDDQKIKTIVDSESKSVIVSQPIKINEKLSPQLNLIIILILSIIILVLSGGYVIYYYFNKNKK